MAVRRAVRAVGVREVGGRSVRVPVSRPVVGSVLVVRGAPEAPRVAVRPVAGVPVGPLVARAVQRALGVVDGGAQVQRLQCVAGWAVFVAAVTVAVVAVALVRPRAVSGAVVVAPAVAAPGVAVRGGGGAAGGGAAGGRRLRAGHSVS